jgi:hypothetical protein
MKKITLSLLVVSSLIAFSCKDEKEIVDPVVIDNCDTVTYDKHIASIISKSCFDGCHNGNQSPLLTSYATVKAQVDNGKFKKEVITDQTMPQGSSLSATELGLIECWINNGAIEK